MARVTCVPVPVYESDDSSVYTLALGGSPSIRALCDDLPPLVYFIRTKDDLVKIGFTTDLAQRKRHYGSGWQHILAILPGSRVLEAQMHERFAPYLARGQEYFHPAPAVIDYINEIRDSLGVPALS